MSKKISNEIYKKILETDKTSENLDKKNVENYILEEKMSFVFDVFSSLKNHEKLITYKNGISIYKAKRMFELYTPFKDPYLDVINIIIPAIELNIDIKKTKLPFTRNILVLYIINELSKIGKFDLLENKFELYEDIKKEIFILIKERKKNRKKIITFNQIYDGLYEKNIKLNKNDVFTVIYHYFDFHIDYKKDINDLIFKEVVLKI